MSAKYARCPYCGTRTKIEYGARLREHSRPNGNLCSNYDLKLRPIVNPTIDEVLQAAHNPKVTP